MADGALDRFQAAHRTLSRLLHLHRFMKLSILMPVYNERTVVERCISLVVTAPLPENMDRELVIVDDCPPDGPWEILRRPAAGSPKICLSRHDRNAGKGAAVRTAIEKATGDFSLI